VLEYGVGLSTELLLLEGYKVLNFEPLDFYGDLFSRKTGQGVISYDVAEGPPPLSDKYPFALVDSPKNGRSKEVEHAVKYTTRYIYMHNPFPDQTGVLEEAGWTPMTELSTYHGHYRFYASLEEARSNAQV
jgi:hypothetical protein